jgi:hypothetical protein
VSLDFPEYPHIDTIWKRDEKGKVIEGDYSTEEFAYLAYNSWEWYEKVDGTNIRIAYIADEGGHVVIGGRTDKAQIQTNLLTFLQEKFTPDKFSFFGGDVILYGEGFGANIQKVGPLYGPKPRFALFDVKVGHWWLTQEAVTDIARDMDIERVPWVGSGGLHWAVAHVRAGDLANRSRYGEFVSEGLVGRPAANLSDRGGRRIIAKIKGKDFK